MTYRRFVEIGRVAYVAYGPDKGKLVVITNVVDQNRALVDGPCSGVGRKVLNFKQLHLTGLQIPKLAHGARTGTVKKHWEKNNLTQKWQESSWAKKLEAREKREQLTDFDRFKLMKAKQARNRLVRVEFGKLKKASKKQTGANKRKPNKKIHKKN